VTLKDEETIIEPWPEEEDDEDFDGLIGPRDELGRRRWNLDEIRRRMARRRVRADWPEPTPLDTVERLPFPVDALPDVLGDFVRALSVETSTPPALAGLLVLSAVASVVARRVEVVDPWDESVNLYVCVTLPPGERKSPVFAQVFASVRAIELDQIERTAEARQEETVRIRTEIRLAKKAQTEALKDPLDRGALAAAIEDERAARAQGEPQAPRLMASDATPETIEVLLRDQGGRIAIVSDEGEIFGTLAGRYSKGGTAPNLDGVLKGHDGSDPILVDRIGRGAVRVDRPAIVFALTVQPEVLRQIGENGDLVGRGFCARFLWAVPDSDIGSRPLTIVPVPSAVRKAYTEVLTDLDAFAFEVDGEPMLLELAPEAAKAFLTFRGDV